MKHLLSVADLSRQDVEALFRLAAEWKARAKARALAAPLAGHSLALVFEKPSLRTRVTFEVGMAQLGGGVGLPGRPGHRARASGAGRRRGPEPRALG